MKILTYSRGLSYLGQCCLILILFVSESVCAQALNLIPIRQIDIQGLKRSDREWFRTLIGVSPPCLLSGEQIEKIRGDIVASRVFSYVEIKVLDETLFISVEEKWTLIPVFRGADGGGTPLLVLGGYESHLAGRQWILGGEFRKYGNAPIGGLVYTQLPNLFGDHSLFAAESSRLQRIRDFYDRDQSSVGSLETNEFENRIIFLSPTRFLEPHFRLGLDLRYFNVGFGDSSGLTPEAKFRAGSQKYTTLAAFEFDDLVLDNLLFNGIRSMNKFGLIYGGENNRQYPVAELEIFYYKTFFQELGLALHGFFTASDSNAAQAQRFLGGFDSIRGLPDGAIWGNKAFYANAESLYLFFASHYLWLQSAVFLDFGEAAQRWQDLEASRRTSVGVGLRIAVPQIYRLVVRFDYAWNLETGSSGVSLGFNQFFQPYTPSLTP